VAVNILLLLAAVAWAARLITSLDNMALMAEIHHSLALPLQVVALVLVRLITLAQTATLEAQVVEAQVIQVILLLEAHLLL
jgi:hypothetical protein